MHDVEANAALRMILESLRDSPDDAESKRLPKSHGDAVRFDNGIEPHRGVSLLASPREQVLPKRTSTAPGLSETEVLVVGVEQSGLMAAGKLGDRCRLFATQENANAARLVERDGGARRGAAHHPGRLREHHLGGGRGKPRAPLRRGQCTHVSLRA